MNLNLLISVILFLGVLIGELVKVSFGVQIGINNGLTVLDLSVALSILILIIKNPLLSRKISAPWLKAAILFITVAFLSHLSSPLSLNLKEKLVSLGYLVRFSSFVLLGLFLSQNVSLKFNHRLFMIYSGVVLALLGLLQLVFVPNLIFLIPLGWDPHNFRTVSTFLDPNFLGIFLVLSLLYLIVSIKSISQQKILSFAFLIIFLTILTTFSRSSMVMFFVSFMLLSIFKKSLGMFLLTLFLSFTLVAALQTYIIIFAQPQNIDRAQSAQFRVTSWQTGLSLWQYHPLLGVGFNNYRYALREYHLAPPDLINSHGGTTNDSSLIFVAATTGAVGLFSYLLFFYESLIFSMKSFLQKNNQTGLISFAGMSGLIASSFFINNLFYPPILFWIFTSLSQIDSNKSPCANS